MPSMSERHQAPAREPARADVTDLQQRYRAIGITAVAAAMRFRNDPEPSDRNRDMHSKPRAA